MNFKEELAQIISKELNIDKTQILELIETPKNQEQGDYALPCFFLSKTQKKPPQKIAEELTKINKEWFTTQNEGSYLNFKIKIEILAKNTLEKINEPYILERQEKTNIGIESPSPNSNKPLHLGHVRNMLLGLSLKNIYEKTGKKVTWFDIVNDKGTHICKSMLAYQKQGNNKTPEQENKKPDHFVGEYYVKFSELLKQKPELEQEAQKMLQKWEQKNPETIKLWKQMREWWLQGTKKTYEEYGIKIDSQTYESDIYEEGKKIVLEGLKQGIFKKDETNAIYIDLEKEGLGKKYLLRSDGTTIYITQDIYLAKKRFTEHKLEEFRYIVGSEQIYHFKTLFEIFKKLNYDFWNKCIHIAYGMIYLPSGRMKSREGTIIDADDFKKELEELAEKELQKRYLEITKEELQKRKKIIATGAINFFILKYDSLKDFTYYPEKSLNFQGESGPYVQYAHARICSILRKEQPKKTLDYSKLELELEKQILNKLRKYEETIHNASKNNKPSIITTYLLELAQLLNSYYHETPILKEEEQTKNARLHLINKTRIILKDGLALLGITAPEEM
ncbi:arginine--tRNA ligase [Candidatus Woesearchaeota archaeon]|nr:arginine--tRNA ligase [Candidatus Woesearchaeota archaeon]